MSRSFNWPAPQMQVSIAGRKERHRAIRAGLRRGVILSAYEMIVPRR
jgi:hypothetical protein